MRHNRSKTTPLYMQGVSGWHRGVMPLGGLMPLATLILCDPIDK